MILKGFSLTGSSSNTPCTSYSPGAVGVNVKLPPLPSLFGSYDNGHSTGPAIATLNLLPCGHSLKSAATDTGSPTLTVSGPKGFSSSDEVSMHVVSYGVFSSGIPSYAMSIAWSPVSLGVYRISYSQSFGL